jgi:hypothetical protein
VRVRGCYLIWGGGGSNGLGLGSLGACKRGGGGDHVGHNLRLVGHGWL